MNTQELGALSPEQLRLKLACLIDPTVRTELHRVSMLAEAVDFASELPRFYSDDFDRMQLWDRIGNGLLAAAQKSDGNCELFVNQVLSYIKASPTTVAASDSLSSLISTYEKRDLQWKQEFIHQFQEYHYLIVVKARSAWQEKKGQVQHA